MMLYFPLMCYRPYAPIRASTGAYGLVSACTDTEHPTA